MHSELYCKIHRYLKEGKSHQLEDKESLFYFLFNERKEGFYFELNIEKEDESNLFLLKFRNEPTNNFSNIGSIDLVAENFNQFSNGSELSLDFKTTPISSFSALFKSIGGLQKDYEKSKQVSSVINSFFENHFNQLNNISSENSLYNAYYKTIIHKGKGIKYDRNIVLLLGENNLKGHYQHVTPSNAMQRRKILFELNKTLINKRYSVIDRESLEQSLNDELINKLIQSEIVYFLTNGFIYNVKDLSELSYNINAILQEEE